MKVPKASNIWKHVFGVVSKTSEFPSNGHICEFNLNLELNQALTVKLNNQIPISMACCCDNIV